MNNCSHECWHCQHLKDMPESIGTVGSANSTSVRDADA